ncbi:MAG: alpha/beta hydrolase [Sideroxydans sp.]|nr:alpha/beta hydrolase [Sideroxydans sp.]
MNCSKILNGLAYCAQIVFVIGLSGCAASPTILTKYESYLGIHDGVSREFHSSLYYPKGLALGYPGYVIGIQKADQEKVRGPRLSGFPSFLSMDSPYLKEGEKTDRWGLGSMSLLKKLRGDPKSMFVSHVTRFSFKQDIAPNPGDVNHHPYPYIDSCFLYNAFQSPFFQPPDMGNNSKWNDLHGAIAWKVCDGAPPWTGKSTEPSMDKFSPEEFYSNGLPAIDSLAKHVAQDLKENAYTHVLILVMGWNTAQDEAIRNFNDITGNLLDASRETATANGDSRRQLPFRPIVIGVNWPSYWSSGITNVFSYANKAKDADELGITWLNLLVNRDLPEAMQAAGVKKVPIVLIGHSFGARVVTRVAAAYPALKLENRPSKGIYSGANLVIGLEGAVSINRFFPDTEDPSPSDEGAPLRDFAKLESTRFAFTASLHDRATGPPVFWFPPSGSIKSYRLACDAAEKDWRRRVFHCLSAHDVGGSTPLVQPAVCANNSDRKSGAGFRVCEKDNQSDCLCVGDSISMTDTKVLYLDTSDGITEFNTLGTGGNAHSDIFRLPMGRLLWLLISSLPPMEP